MAYILEHSHLGFCWWDLPAIILLAGVSVLFAVQHYKLKKEKKDLEDQLSTLYADDTVYSNPTNYCT